MCLRQTLGPDGTRPGPRVLPVGYRCSMNRVTMVRVSPLASVSVQIAV